MSDEIKAGDIRISANGIEIKILAVEGRYLWAKWDNEPAPRTGLKRAYEYTTPKPNFFEENVTYRNIHSGNKWTVWHVHKMADGMVAIAQHTDGTPTMVTQYNWDSGLYERV